MADLSSLNAQQQDAVKNCLIDLEKDPVPTGRRMHPVTPAGAKPKIYTVDVFPNKSYKISFQLDGGLLILRRVATHKQIDRRP
ncbi:MAG: hypothetical protein WBK26_16845 [Burkholderiaceae bacterium]